MAYTYFLLVLMFLNPAFANLGQAAMVVGTATSVSSGLKGEARKNAMLGGMVMMAGVKGAIHFGKCAMSCTATEVPGGPPGGQAGTTEISTPEMSFCIPGGTLPACRVLNGAMAAVFASGAVEGFNKMGENNKIGDDLDNLDHQPSLATLPECQGNEAICNFTMTAGKSGKFGSGSELCLGDPSTPACVTLDDNKKPQFKIKDKKLTKEEMEDFIKANTDNPQAQTALDGAKKHFKNKVQSALGNLTQLDDTVTIAKTDEDKGEGRDSSSSLAGEEYEAGEGFDLTPSGERNHRRRRSNEGLMAQFKKKKKREPAHKPVVVGNNKVGAIQDNIFMMAHRRYQKLRDREEFIEKSKPGLKKSVSI